MTAKQNEKFTAIMDALNEVRIALVDLGRAMTKSALYAGEPVTPQFLIIPVEDDTDPAFYTSDPEPYIKILEDDEFGVIKNDDSHIMPHRVIDVWNNLEFLPIYAKNVPGLITGGEWREIDFDSPIDFDSENPREI